MQHHVGMRPADMEPLAIPQGAHIPMRRAVRHPREILTLVIAILTSLGLLSWAVAEVMLSFEEARDPDVYALIIIWAPVIVWFLRGQLWAQQRLRGIKLTPAQFPEAHAMLVDAAARAGLSYVPDAYVVLGNGVINAAASGHGFRRFVMVHSDLLEVGGAAREPEALRFVIAHEVGHIAAGHVSYWRILATMASQWIPFVGSTLSRAQEYTADNYGFALVPQGAKPAMATLAGGKYLGRSVDVDTMADRAVTEPGFFVWVVNALATHPALLWRMHALRDRRAPGRLLWRPTTPSPWARELDPQAHRLPELVGFAPTPPATPRPAAVPATPPQQSRAVAPVASVPQPVGGPVSAERRPEQDR